jgi:EAL domain-containing protein (putative c-di-GMP-specific phosphodiesterase class I)
MTLLDTTEKMRRDRVLIEALIDDPSGLGPDFQPLKDLRDDSVVAYKATGRGQTGTDLDSTLALLSSAQTGGLMERLDWAFRCLAFDVALDAGLTSELHLTPEPETFGSPCPPRLATAFGRGRRSLSIGAEVHDYGFEHPGLDGAVAEWRGWGWKVVAVDVSPLVDASFLRRLDLLRPDVVQVDLALRRAGDPQLSELLEWGLSAGAEIHATGVDTEARRQQALDLGCSVGRGRLLGAPAPLQGSSQPSRR